MCIIVRVCVLESTAVSFSGYLLKEIKKADIPLPEGEMNPVAPLPKHIMSIMVSALLIYYMHIYF